MINNPFLTSLTEQINQVVTRSPSPFMLWLAPIVREVSPTSLTFEYVVSAVMTNPMKTLHGGVSAGIMDDIIGATILCSGKQHSYTTINNVIDYFSVAKLGDTITAKTQIIKAGRQVINVQFELWNLPKNRLIARGYSNNLITERFVSEVNDPLLTTPTKLEK